MNFSKQLKKYREQHGFSQEVLAEKIYVTRQTISKWENDKSYPDIHNLIALSALFNISLDELVKGDVEMMKEELSKRKLVIWTWNMLAAIILTPLSIGPVFRLWGFRGLIVTAFLMIWLLVSCIKLEKFKKNHHLRTYSEIVAFLDNMEKPDEAVVMSELKNKNNVGILYFIGTVVLSIIVLAIGFLLVY